MDSNQFFETITPALVSFMAVAIPALLAWITAIVRGWANKQAEKNDRQALHMALETGALAAEQKYGETGDKMAKAAFAADYVKKSVPDAIANLNPPDDVLVKLAMAKRENLEHRNAQTPPC
jgi:hypothetical protein